MTHTHSSDTAAHGISFFLVGSVNAGTFTLHGVLGLMVSVVGRAGEVARARARSRTPMAPQYNKPRDGVVAMTWVVGWVPKASGWCSGLKDQSAHPPTG